MKQLRSRSAVIYAALLCYLNGIRAVSRESKGKVGIINGDITIGGLVPVYQPLKYGNCSTDFGGGFGIQRLEAMIYAINKVRR